MAGELYLNKGAIKNKIFKSNTQFYYNNTFQITNSSNRKIQTILVNSLIRGFKNEERAIG